MRYRELANWILGDMRMSEMYQPAAIISLIYHGGTATLEQLHAHLEMRRQERDPTVAARELSETRTSPCQVLVGNGVASEPEKGRYVFLDFDTYTPQQLTAIVALCEDSIAHWNRNRKVEE
jgi:hypothetical protein